MSTIVVIQSTDIIGNSRADINTNFANLNADKMEGPAASVDSEIALYSGTGGKTLKRASTTGLLKAASGVIAAAIADTDYLTPGTAASTYVPTTRTVNGKALSGNITLGLASADFANQGTATTVLHGNAAGNPAFSAIVEADITLADNTTNDVSTTKHGFVPKAPNDTTKFLRGDGTWQVPAGGSTSYVTFSSDGSVVGRWLQAADGNGTITTGSQGIAVTTGSSVAGSARARLDFSGGSGNFKIFDKTPRVELIYYANQVSNGSGTASCFMGLGEVTVTATGHTFTNNHIGFKVIKTASGTATLYATQADGTTENASAALTTMANDDVLELIFVVGASSVDYYWAKNGGAISAATNLTSNKPATSGAVGSFQFSASNDNDGTATFSVRLMSTVIKRVN